MRAQKTAPQKGKQSSSLDFVGGWLFLLQPENFREGLQRFSIFRIFRLQMKIFQSRIRKNRRNIRLVQNAVRGEDFRMAQDTDKVTFLAVFGISVVHLAGIDDNRLPGV